MNEQELEVVGRYFEKEMIDWGLNYFSKRPNDITLQDLLASPDEALHFSKKVYEFSDFFAANYESEQLREHPLFNFYKKIRKRNNFIDHMQMLTAIRGTKPMDKAFKIYTLKAYRRATAAQKKGKVAYAAWLTAKGPNEWVSPLTPYYFVRAYFWLKWFHSLTSDKSKLAG